MGEKWKSGKKGVCPQITQIYADTESRFDQAERIPMGIGISSEALLCGKSSSASICGQFRIRLPLAALGLRAFAPLRDTSATRNGPMNFSRQDAKTPINSVFSFSLDGSEGRQSA
jgi:hypothetical protein